jgi:2'-5' RNA ligase
LFVAVEVPPSVRSAVAAAVEPLRSSQPALRWVDPQRYHLTLVFLGSVDSSLVDDIAAAVGPVCRSAAAFELALDGTVGTFGRRVLWAGLRPSAPLAALASAVSAALASVVALPDGDRAFSAHLTLARAGRAPLSRAGVADVSVPALAWMVGRAVLMRSAGGYSVERVFDLSAANT